MKGVWHGHTTEARRDRHAEGRGARGQCRSSAPSVDAEYGVLPGHRPLLAALRIRIVSYVTSGVSHRTAVGSSSYEYARDHAGLLNDAFIAQHHVDSVRVRLELKHADEALDQFEGEPGSAEHLMLVERELWTVTQLELYGDPPPPAVMAYRFTGPLPEKYEHLGDVAEGDAPKAPALATGGGAGARR